MNPQTSYTRSLAHPHHRLGPPPTAIALIVPGELALERPLVPWRLNLLPSAIPRCRPRPPCDVRPDSGDTKRSIVGRRVESASRTSRNGAALGPSSPHLVQSGGNSAPCSGAATLIVYPGTARGCNDARQSFTKKAHGTIVWLPWQPAKLSWLSSHAEVDISASEHAICALSAFIGR